MRISRRTVAWSGLLVIVASVLVIRMQSGHGQSQAGGGIDEARLSPADTGPPVHDAPAGTPSDDQDATWAPRGSEFSRDSSDARCVQVVTDIARIAEKERGAGDTRQEADAHEEWLIAELGELQSKATGARDPELLLAALLLRPHEDHNAQDAANQTMLLEFGTRAAGSGSPLLAWHALRACAGAGAACPFAHLEHDLLGMQRKNAEAWALVATLKYQRGDITGALAAMQGAARAPTSTWHWSETVGLVERVVATHTAVTFPDSASTAFGAATTAIPQQSGLLTMCRVESASSRAWGEACLAYGTLRQKHNEAEIGKSLAYTIRRDALTGLGDVDGAEAMRIEFERFIAERAAGGQELVLAGFRLTDALVNSGRPGMHAYLDAVGQSGEIPGRRQFLRQQAPVLMERAGLLEREGARECIAELFLEPQAVGETRQALLEHRLHPGDELHITLRDRNGRSIFPAFARRVGPDGIITLPRDLTMSTAGLTTAQLQRELVAALSSNDRVADAQVIAIPRRSGEELRSAFDAARSEPRATAR